MRLRRQPKGQSIENSDYDYENTALRRSSSRRSKLESRKCDRCLKKFNLEKSWLKHQCPLAPKIDVNWPCKYCSESFSTQRLLRVHQKSHKANCFEEEDPSYKFDVVQDLYICEVCSAEFQKVNEVQAHIKSHLPELKCDLCGELFESAFHLGVHSMQHSEDKKIKCPFCTYVSKGSNPYSFKSHMNYIHLKKFPFYCKQCGQGFKQFKIYQDHENSHSGRKPYVCVVCNKSFTFEKYLIVHQTRTHQVSSGDSNIERRCQKCQRVFRNFETLNEHRESCVKKNKTLKKPNSFLCDTCGQGFIEKAKLLKHIRVHKGDLPFVCTWCDKRFPQKDYLKTHERVHTREKPYTCHFCGKCFGFHAPFRVHIRTHTGERPYKCDSCSKGFTTNQGLKLHRRDCRMIN